MSVRAWRAVLFAVMVGGLAFAVRPLAPHEGPENWFPHADKVHHLWYFGLLWWLSLKAGFRAGWPLALGLIGYGVSIELAQSLTPARKVQGLDLLADSGGVALGWLLTRQRSGREPQEDRR